MSLPKFEQLGLIGCGLMGGSFALALKRAGLVKRVVGYSKSPATTDRARQLGVIDIEAPSALQAVSGSDVVLVAVPVAATEATFKAIRHGITPDMLVMDVGSTKRDVVEAARRSLGAQGVAFVPCHPIAGKESAGVDHADANLYRGRQVIITPTPATLAAQCDRAQKVWEAVGSQVRRMTPEAHDTAFAAVSHLPHLLAFAYINGIGAQADANSILSLGGPGFRDFSRIAAGDPKVWRDILLANRDQVLAQAAHFQSGLAALQAAMQAGDGQALESLILQASGARARWQPGGA
jgi:prephenate dehydrogenase